ncbi:MAG: phage head closure protein [Acidimicrobiia bacterium]|nr:phage head closure protein [Acidimicrobiia bacterium]
MQEATEQRDHRDGGVYREWAGVADVWAQIMPLSGKELFEAQQIRSDTSHKIRIRFLRGLRPTDHRIVYGDRIFNIDAVTNTEERDREMILMCTERNPDDQEDC